MSKKSKEYKRGLLNGLIIFPFAVFGGLILGRIIGKLLIWLF